MQNSERNSSKSVSASEFEKAESVRVICYFEVDSNFAFNFGSIFPKRISEHPE